MRNIDATIFDLEEVTINSEVILDGAEINLKAEKNSSDNKKNNIKNIMSND